MKNTKTLDQAPPEAQRALLQTLIRSITIYDDRVELKMYVGKLFEEIICSLPEVAHKDADNTPKNAKTPQKTCGVTTSLKPGGGGLASDSQSHALGANELPSWLGRMDSNHDSQTLPPTLLTPEAGSRFGLNQWRENSYILLPGKDSDLDSQTQILMCYHYTTGQRILNFNFIFLLFVAFKNFFLQVFPKRLRYRVGDILMPGLAAWRLFTALQAGFKR